MLPLASIEKKEKKKRNPETKRKKRASDSSSRIHKKKKKKNKNKKRREGTKEGEGFVLKNQRERARLILLHLLRSLSLSPLFISPCERSSCFSTYRDKEDTMASSSLIAATSPPVCSSSPRAHDDFSSRTRFNVVPLSLSHSRCTLTGRSNANRPSSAACSRLRLD